MAFSKIKRDVVTIIRQKEKVVIIFANEDSAKAHYEAIKIALTSEEK